MDIVRNEVSIAGAVEAVFDLACTARFWPEWHANSLAVAGVIERPYQVGDVVHERIDARGLVIDTMWRVVELVRPSRVVLVSDLPSFTLTYAFDADEREVTFRRELKYDAEFFGGDRAEFAQGLAVSSQEACLGLKAVVERILAAESEPLATPSGR